jgi:isopenicillin-N epimerase
MTDAVLATAPAAAEQVAALVGELSARPGSAQEIAVDESFWRLVRRLFPVDLTMTNLNNGGVSPSPAPVIAALKRHVDHANLAPAYVLWEVLKPRRELVRQRLAALCGCDPEEVAMMRNASEALQTCQLGFPLAAGDEVLTTRLDYVRMLTTWAQRARRDGVVVRAVDLLQSTQPLQTPDTSRTPVTPPDDEIVELLLSHVTPRTRLLHISQVIYFTGQILPVRRIVEAARRRGLPVFVDGAHAFAHLGFTLPELGCDYYAASLHKWLCAPHGTGLLYVRRDKIPSLWPLMAAPARMDGDIRKFEEIGTHSEAPYLAILEALDFHAALGAERKLARLLYLRDRWARRLERHPRIRLLTDLAPGRAAGFASFVVEGMAHQELAARLWEKHRILVTAFDPEEFDGMRVTPSFYTLAEEVDRFAAAVEEELAV